eukprot:5742690-Amphidinium_carterae.1
MMHREVAECLEQAVSLLARIIRNSRFGGPCGAPSSSSSPHCAVGHFVLVRDLKLVQASVLDGVQGPIEYRCGGIRVPRDGNILLLLAGDNGLQSISSSQYKFPCQPTAESVWDSLDEEKR